MSQQASVPAPTELTKRCAQCQAEVQARVASRTDNQNKGRWYYCCNSCNQFFCWGDYRPGVSQHGHDDATQIFNSQPERSRALPYTMSFDQVLSGELYTPDDDKMTITLHYVDADTFGLRTYTYDGDFVKHIKLLHWTLRKWDKEEQLWLCPTGWYKEIVGHMMAAGFPVDEADRLQLEAQLRIHGAARVPAAPPAPSRQPQRLARHLFGEEEERRVATTAELAARVRVAAARLAQEAISAPRSRPQSQDTAASSAKRSKRAHAKEAEDEEAQLCVVCMREKRQYVLVPCGHLMYCGSCARTVAGKGSCAMCRQPVERCMKVYT